MARAYLRLDPAFFDRKVIDQKYPPGAVAALIGVLCHAEHQPSRGRFRDERVLKALLGPLAKWIPFLIEHRDLLIKRGVLYADGWDEWQEGDWKVGERVKRIRERHGDVDVGPTPGAQRTANWRLRTKVFERDSYTCRYCGISDYPRDWLVLEHVDPEGPTDEDNLVTACRSCNKLKGGRTPEQAGMVLRDASQVTLVTNGGDASPTESGDASPDSSPRQSVIDSGSVSGKRSEKVPLPEVDARANGRKPDHVRGFTRVGAIAADLAEKSEDWTQALTIAERDEWSSFGPNWDAFKAAWLARGFRHPPAGSDLDDPDAPNPSQRALLWSVLDAWPNELPRWIAETPKKLTASQVVARVIDRWHRKRDEGVDRAAAEELADTDRDHWLGVTR